MGAALAVFVIASLTDCFDGRVARRQGTTAFGAFLDPLADKILISISFICFASAKQVDGGLIPIWMAVVVVGRELTVAAVAFIFLVKYKIVIHSPRFVKYNMPTTSLVVFFGLALLAFYDPLNMTLQQCKNLIHLLMYGAVAMSVVSGSVWVRSYFRHNGKHICEQDNGYP